MKRPRKSDYSYYLSLSSGGTGIDYRAYSSALEEYVEWLRGLMKYAHVEEFHNQEDHYVMHADGDGDHCLTIRTEKEQ